MNDRVTRYLKRFKAIITFFQNRLGDFVAPSKVPGYVTQLQDVVDKMEDAGAGKVGGGNAGKVGAIEAIRTDLRNIHRTATALELTNPGLGAQFPLPENSDTSVVTVADAYLAALTPQPNDTTAQTAAKATLVQLFIAHDLPASFVTDLQTDRDSINPAATAQESKRQEKVEDTKALETQISKGIGLTNLLDAAAHNKYTRDADTLRAWQSASHLERAPKREKKAGDDKPTGSGNATK